MFIARLISRSQLLEFQQLHSQEYDRRLERYEGGEHEAFQREISNLSMYA